MIKINNFLINIIKGLIYLLVISIAIMFVYLLFINYEKGFLDKIRISSLFCITDFLDFDRFHLRSLVLDFKL